MKFFRHVLSLLLTSSAAMAQCSLQLMSDDYSVPALWTPVVTTPGSVTFTANKLCYNSTHGSSYERMYRSLPATLPDTYWKAACKFTPVSGNGPSHYVMAFTAGSLDPISYDGSGSYALTNQDAIMVYYIYQGGTPSATCCSDPNFGPWQMVIRSKKGNVMALPSAGISILTLGQAVYPQLERLSPSLTCLHVYSDPAGTTDLPGSPVYYCIDSTITGLNTLQHGVVTWSGWYRELSAKIDNMTICLSQSADTIAIQGCADSLATLYADTLTGASYSWSDGISCNSCTEANVTVPSTGINYYSVSTNVGCGPVFQKFFSVEMRNDCVTAQPPPTEPCRTRDIPNVFTPNNDHQNDEFIIHLCPSGDLQIYNRWGQAVYSSSGVSVALWNGKLMNTGAEVPDGIYYFILSEASGTKTGYITVLR